MKSLIQVIISSLILCVATSSFADEAENKEKQRIKTQNMKFMIIAPVKSLSLIEGGIAKINQNCCEDNFDKKDEIQSKINDKKDAIQAKSKKLLGMCSDVSDEEKLNQLNTTVDQLTATIAKLIEKRNAEAEAKAAKQAEAAKQAKAKAAKQVEPKAEKKTEKKAEPKATKQAEPKAAKQADTKANSKK